MNGSNLTRVEVCLLEYSLEDIAIRVGRYSKNHVVAFR